MLQLVIVLISSYGHFQHNSLTLEQIQPVVGAQIASVVQQDAVPIKFLDIFQIINKRPLNFAFFVDISRSEVEIRLFQSGIFEMPIIRFLPNKCCSNEQSFECNFRLFPRSL